MKIKVPKLVGTLQYTKHRSSSRCLVLISGKFWLTSVIGNTRSFLIQENRFQTLMPSLHLSVFSLF